MLYINLEFRRGILFIRLCGDLVEKTSLELKEVNDLIEKQGIKYVVLNMEQLRFVDNVGMSMIIDNYKKVNHQDGKIVICGINEVVGNKIKKDPIYSYLYKSANELNALQMLHI